MSNRVESLDEVIRRGQEWRMVSGQSVYLDTTERYLHASLALDRNGPVEECFDVVLGDGAESGFTHVDR